MPLCPICSIGWKKKTNFRRVRALKKIVRVGSVTMYGCDNCGNFFMKRTQTIRCPNCRKVMKQVGNRIWLCRVCGSVFDSSQRPLRFLFKTTV